MGGNRAVNKLRVQHIAKSMALHPEIFPLRPILVNDKFEIIDGQHRYNAAKMLGIPVWYEVAEDIGQEQALIINQNQQTWNVMDYAKAYAYAGNDDYKEFIRVVKEHPHVPKHIIINYIGGNNKNNMRRFRAGEFKAVTLLVGKVFLDYLEDVAEYAPKIHLQTPARAMFTVFQTDGYDHDRFLAKLAIAPQNMLKTYGRVEDVLRSVEDIYNWKQQKDIVRFYG